MTDLNREVGEIKQKVWATHDLLKDHIEDQQAHNTTCNTRHNTIEQRLARAEGGVTTLKWLFGVGGGGGVAAWLVSLVTGR